MYTALRPAYTQEMKRLQIYIPEAMDAALSAEAVRSRRSKADLIREYVGERLPDHHPERNGLDDLIGMFEGSSEDSASVDDVVYGR